MKLINLGLEYLADDRMPDTYLNSLEDYLSTLPQKRVRVAVYGMAEAGVKIVDIFKDSTSVELVAGFDMCSTIVSKHIAMANPANISEFPDLDLIINTAPPQFVFDVLKTIFSQNSNLSVLNLYDIFSYVTDDRNWDFSYKILVNDVGLEGDVAVFHKEVASVINTRIDEKVKERRSRQKKTREEALNKLELEKMCLGKYLEGELRKAIKDPNSKIEKLINLAENYPFYAIARDAAACLLVQDSKFKAALDVFEPTLLEYPCCHFSLTKLAELKALSGDLVGAETFISRALYFSPNSTELQAVGQMIESGDISSILDKWMRRDVCPEFKNRKVRLKCSTPVWGESYIKIFMELGLRSLLASGNIPHAAKEHDLSYTIYTREQDFECIKSYPEWKTLKSLIPAELISIESLVEKNNCGSRSFCKYSLMTLCQNDALEQAYNAGSVAFIPIADFMFSADFLRAALQKLDTGYDILLVNGIRVRHEPFVEKIVPKYNSETSLDIASVELFAEGVQYIHRYSAQAMDENYTPLWPSYFLRKNSDGNFIHNMFGSNPLFIYPQELLKIDSTLDADLPYKVTDGGLGKYAYSDESEGMLMFEVVAEDSELDRYCDKKRSSAFASYWIHGTTDPMARFLGTRLMVYKSSHCEVELGEEYFKAVEDTVKLVL
ncbi:hypothetical protein [Maridesulfovibrio frigidus]|uniref:hypothetical protein n=1 Tax=Maridesulfovibrio frigidus TaxID=340956 RepID=UPI0004E0E456|nr:hypothetical protein [Maridesulfovibrio frigidus]